MSQQQKDRITDGSLIAAGENPNGMVTITPNGIAYDRSEGSNHQYYWKPGHNGPRWELTPPETLVIGAPVTGAEALRPQGRSKKNINRSGE